MNGWVRGAIATLAVGASFPVSQALVGYPYTAGQCIRYGIGALILTALLRGRLGKPTRNEFGLLFLVAAVGMVGFNLAILAAVDRIGATNVGVVVGASPILLSLAGNRAVLFPAAVVFAGAAIVNGADPNLDPLGALLAVAALGAEVGFTLLAAPLLPRLGPTRVAAWAAWLATAQLAILSPHFPTPTTSEAAAIAYLAVITTALAFVLWFGAVQRLGSGRAGLLVGLMPVAAVTVDALLNDRAPSPTDIAGTALVTIGVVLGASPVLRWRNRQPHLANVVATPDEHLPAARHS